MQAVIVDDTSPEIDYLTGWYYQTTNTADYNSTTAYSGNPNSEFKYVFTGTSVAVFGCVLPNNTALSTYTLDADTQPATFTNPLGTTYQARQLFFQSPTLADEEHTLIVAVPGATIGLPWTTFCFDYLEYTPSGAAAPASAAGSEANGSSATKGPTPEPSSSPSNLPQSAPSSAPLPNLSSGYAAKSPGAVPSSEPLTSPSVSPAPSSSLSSSSAGSPSETSLSSSSAVSPSATPANTSSTAVSDPLSSLPAGQLAAQPRSTPDTFRVILPAVLVPCIVVLALLCAAWWYQRRRLQGLEDRIEQSSTPYTQTSLLHRFPSRTTVDSEVATETAESLHFSMCSPRPNSTYSTDIQFCQRTTVRGGSMVTNRDRLPTLPSLLATVGARGSAISENFLARSPHGKGQPQSLAEAATRDAPPMYSAEGR